MRPIPIDVARSAVCVCLCVSGTPMSRAKTAEPIEMPFEGRGRLVHVGTKHRVLDGCAHRRHPANTTERSRVAVMRPYVKLIKPPVFFGHYLIFPEISHLTGTSPVARPSVAAGARGCLPGPPWSAAGRARPGQAGQIDRIQYRRCNPVSLSFRNPLHTHVYK